MEKDLHREMGGQKICKREKGRGANSYNASHFQHGG